MCTTSSDNHAWALAIVRGDAAHKRREQCSLKVLARNSKRRHWYGCAPTCASAGKGQRAKLYKYICAVRANATRVFIAIDLDLTSAHCLRSRPPDTRPHHLTSALVERGHRDLLKGLDGSGQIVEGDDGKDRA